MSLQFSLIEFVLAKNRCSALARQRHFDDRHRRRRLLLVFTLVDDDQTLWSKSTATEEQRENYHDERRLTHLFSTASIKCSLCELHNPIVNRVAAAVNECSYLARWAL